MNKKNHLVFLCGARDYHAMDWYRSSIELLPGKKVSILTDLIEGEGFKKLISNTDSVYKLIVLDNILLRKQSSIGNIWRNVLKLIVFPLQVLLLKRFSLKNPDAIYHAHSMYYLFLAWATGVQYVGTPQGSDILIKPFTSKLYRFFSIKSLKAANAITVDSVRMKEIVKEISGVEAVVIQNGIDIDTINIYNESGFKQSDRNLLLSIRGYTPLYRISEILKARNSSRCLSTTPLTLIYPFHENNYKLENVNQHLAEDKDLGRVDRKEMYKLLFQSKLVISIPSSDSSPRSVYEAIFCGCAVAITYNTYYDILPNCMKSRIILTNLDENNWLDIALEKANKIVQVPYIPSYDALNLFNQKESFRQIESLLFR